jgi:hypothetical protein
MANASSETRLSYEVVRNGDVIGNIQAVKRVTEQQVDYTMESNVQIRLLLTITMYSRVTGTFRNGFLQNGSVVRRVNGKDRANARIILSNDHYLIEEKEQKTRFTEKIFYSSARILHDEPSGITRIFSENFKKFIPIRELRPHYYELTLPDGNKNFYTYVNGVCTLAEINTDFSRALFRLKR